MPIRSLFETEAEWLDHLRSWFAGQALASGLCPFNLHEHALVAGWCLKVADALLTERTRSKVEAP